MLSSAIVIENFGKIEIASNNLTEEKLAQLKRMDKEAQQKPKCGVSA